MKRPKNHVWATLTLLLAAGLTGCRGPAGELLTINLSELADAKLLTAWTLDEAVRPEECFELAPDRPLGFVRKAVLAWPSYVHGRDAWCQLAPQDADVLLPDYRDDSNDVYLHIISR